MAADPAGFQDIVATKPLLSASAYLLLAVGIALALLGFLGCCGALRRSRPLLLAVSEGRRVGAAGCAGCRDQGLEGVGGCPWRSQKSSVPHRGSVSTPPSPVPTM